MTYFAVVPPATPSATSSAQPSSRIGTTDSAGPAVWLFLAFLISSVFAGRSDLLGLPVAPHRILLGLSLVPIASLLRRSCGPRLHSTPPYHQSLMVATGFWAVCSALAAGTLFTNLGFFALLDRLLLPFMSFVLAPLIFRRQADRQLLLKCLILLGVYLGLTALLEMTGLRQFVFTGYINDPQVGIHFVLARGPFVNAEADGLVMLTCCFAGATGFFRFRNLWRWVSVLACAACSVGCLLTLTRSVWLGCVLAVFVAVGSDPRMRKKLLVIVPAIVVGTGIVLTLVPGLQSAVTARAGTARSIYDRQNTNAAAIRVIEHKPLFGIGWMRFVDEGEDYVRQASNFPITNVHIEVHNVILSRAAELGLPGAALWLSCVLLGPVAVASRRRSRNDPLEVTTWTMVATATLCGWSVAVLSSPVSYPVANMMVWLLAGVLIAAEREHNSRTGEGASQARPA